MYRRLCEIINNLAPSRVYRVFISFIFTVVQWFLVFIVLFLNDSGFGGVWTNVGRFKLRLLICVYHLLILIVYTMLTLVNHPVYVLWVLLHLVVITHVFLVVSNRHSVNCRGKFDRLRSLMGQTGRIRGRMLLVILNSGVGCSLWRIRHWRRMLGNVNVHFGE